MSLIPIQSIPPRTNLCYCYSAQIPHCLPISRRPPSKTMETNSITDIQHAILTIQEAILGGDKYLHGYRIPKRSLPSKLDLVQRELRTIVQCLNLLDHSYAPQSLDSSSRNLIIHRYMAFRAKDSVIATDCAIGHLRHDVFRSSPEMISSVNLILEGTSISTESFHRLLNERAVAIPDESLAGLPSVMDFYRTMQMLGSLLTDLSRMHFVQFNQENGAATCVVPEDVSARQYSTTDQAPPPDVCPGETAWSLTGSDEARRGISETFNPVAYVPTPPSNTGSHDADISRLTSEFATSISPFTNPPNQNADSISAHSLDLNYQFPPRENSKLLHREVQETYMLDNAFTKKPKRRSRNNRRQRQHRLRAPHTFSTSEVTANIGVEQPINMRRRTAINSVPLNLPQTSKLSNVQPLRSTHKHSWNEPAAQHRRNYQPGPRYPLPATVYTISTSSLASDPNDTRTDNTQQPPWKLSNHCVCGGESTPRGSHPPVDTAPSATALRPREHANPRRISKRDARQHDRRPKG